MANKSVTITEPVASDMQAITIIYEAGAAVSVEISSVIRTSHGAVIPGGSCSSIPSEWTAAQQTELGTMAATGAGLVSSKKNFP